jgi:hypothetical protein
MFIQIVEKESKNHSYGDPEIEVAKLALRTFIKHYPDKVQVTIPVGEHEFHIRRMDEITKYGHETYSYKTFEASAWSVPSESVKPECTTTYEFRTFVDEEAFVTSTSPNSSGLLTFDHHDAILHSLAYWRPIEGKKVINELVPLLKQEMVIENLVLLAKTVPDAMRCEQAGLDDVIQRAESWLRPTLYEII